MLRILALAACLEITAVALPANAVGAEKSPTGILFTESFEDSELVKRNWYDGTRFRIVKGALAGKGCIECEWNDGESIRIGPRIALSPSLGSIWLVVFSEAGIETSPPSGSSITRSPSWAAGSAENMTVNPAG